MCGISPSRQAGDAEANSGDETYAFDKNGNRTQRNLGGAAQAYANNRDNEMWSDGVYSFQYDHEGNLVKRTKLSDNSSTEYAWDHRNRLIQVTFKDGAGAVQKTVTESYDPFDHWIGEKSVSGSSGATVLERHFVYDGDQIALEFGPAGKLDGISVERAKYRTAGSLTGLYSTISWIEYSTALSRSNPCSFAERWRCNSTAHVPEAFLLWLACLWRASSVSP